ncbi:hypothetical protein EIP86_008772 [Pleurotus ostreatoroseus]|nr:hypothetical protein EIP86_008772 [Pleurotus ostreatoroseus]
MASQSAPLNDVQSEPLAVASPVSAESSIPAENQITSSASLADNSAPGVMAIQDTAPNDSAAVVYATDAGSISVTATSSPTEIKTMEPAGTLDAGHTDSTAAEPATRTESVTATETETSSASLDVAPTSPPTSQTTTEAVGERSTSSGSLSVPPTPVRGNSAPAVLQVESSTPRDPLSPIIAPEITTPPSEIKDDPIATTSPSKITHSRSRSSKHDDDDDEDRPSIKHTDSGIALVREGVRKGMHQLRDATVDYMQHELRDAAREVVGEVTKNVSKLRDRAKGLSEDNGSVHSGDGDSQPSSMLSKSFSRVKSIKVPKATKMLKVHSLNIKAPSTMQTFVETRSGPTAY